MIRRRRPPRLSTISHVLQSGRKSREKPWGLMVAPVVLADGTKTGMPPAGGGELSKKGSTVW